MPVAPAMRNAPPSLVIFPLHTTRIPTPVLSSMVTPLRSKLIFSAVSRQTSASFNSTSRELLPITIRPVISRTVISGGIWFRSTVRITLHLCAASTRRRSSLRIGIEQRGVHGFYPTRVRGGIELQKPLSFDTSIRLMALRKYNSRRKNSQDGHELYRDYRRWQV